MRYFIVFTGLLSFLLFSSSAAYAFRCGTHIVEPNDTAYMVKKKCGKPTAVYEYISPVYGVNVTGAGRFVQRRCCTASSADWIYDKSSNGFVTTLRFESGRLVDIQRELDVR